MRSPFGFVFVLLLFVPLVACGDPPSRGCTSDSDCRGERICVEGACEDPEPDGDAVCSEDGVCRAVDLCCGDFACFPSGAEIPPNPCECAEIDVVHPGCDCADGRCSLLGAPESEDDVCTSTGGTWGDGECENCCGPPACGGDPKQQAECFDLCCGGPQCYCPSDAPYWDPGRGCFMDAACLP